MTWHLICDECKKTETVLYIHLLQPQPAQKCANCGVDMPAGKGHPWRRDGDPITPSSGNATD